MTKRWRLLPAIVCLGVGTWALEWAEAAEPSIRGRDGAEMVLIPAGESYRGPALRR